MNEDKCANCGVELEWRALPNTDGVTTSDIPFVAGTERVHDCEHCLRIQLEQAKAIIDKPPKDAEGLTRLPGDEVWYPKDLYGKWCPPTAGIVAWDDGRERYCVELMLPGQNPAVVTECGRPVEHCYSTPEAAEKAKEK